MSVALVSSSAPQPRDRGHIYNGSWPFREGKDGPPTRILSNCCNRVTPPVQDSPQRERNETLSGGPTVASCPVRVGLPSLVRPQRQAERHYRAALGHHQLTNLLRSWHEKCLYTF